MLTIFYMRGRSKICKPEYWLFLDILRAGQANQSSLDLTYLIYKLSFRNNSKVHMYILFLLPLVCFHSFGPYPIVGRTIKVALKVGRELRKVAKHWYGMCPPRMWYALRKSVWWNLAESVMVGNYALGAGQNSWKNYVDETQRNGK